MDLEAYAAENARLKAILSNQGFKITYTKVGAINKIVAPRAPIVKHTAVTWARKQGYKGSMGLVRSLTKNRAIGLRKFKNSVERAALIQEGKSFLYSEGFKVPNKYFNKIPMYALKSNDFYETVNAILNSGAEDDEENLSNDQIVRAMDGALLRMKRIRAKTTGTKPRTRKSIKKGKR